MRNPYGERNGSLVTASEVARGLSCGCLCPACGHRLQSHQGSIITPYFSHYRGCDCGASYQSALHMLAKDVLLEEKKILLPGLVVWSDISIARTGARPESETLVEPWTTINVDSVTLEKKLGRIVPDVLVKSNDRVLLVEIKVTHGIDVEKLSYIKSNNLNVIEFDFSKARGIVDKDHVRRVLTQSYRGATTGFGRGQWIHHHEMTRTIEKLTKQYIEKYSIKADDKGGESKTNYSYKPYHKRLPPVPKK